MSENVTEYLRRKASLDAMYEPILNEIEHLYDELVERELPQKLIESLVLDRWNRFWNEVEDIRAQRKNER